MVDAKPWLINSTGAVDLGALIQLTEQGLDAASDEPSEMDAHNDGSDGSEHIESVDSAGSIPESYQSMLEICRTEDWVGPITVFREFWRYDSVTVDISMQGTRVVCTPISVSPSYNAIEFFRTSFLGLLSRSVVW